MTRYLISFDDGAMDIPEEDLPEVGEAAHAVVAAAQAAGVWVTGGGIEGHEASVVATDGAVSDLPYAGEGSHLGGFVVLELPGHEDALEWAGRIASACRCPQEVRPLMYDPAV